MTDIEGSTKLARALGDSYGDLIGRHHSLLRAVWREHGGYELGTEGDSFALAFGDADDAVLAVVEAQRAIAREAWPGARTVRIRIGLHAGYARPVEGEYRALALNQASRIVGCAHGGQTFATDEVVALLTGRAVGVRVRALGRYRVRDFDAPVRLHAITAAGTPRVRAAPRVRPAEGHNIVAPATSLIGRDDELAAIVAGLSPRRVVTLTGPGGVGKTRLALEVALRSAPAWPDGVWFVDLTATVSPDDVPSAIAAAVGASMSPGGDPWADVLSHLELRHLLIVLDNCEHVLDAVARLVHDVTDRAPGCAVLATSRTPFGLLNEHIRRLGVLAATDEDDPGVQLFLQRSAPASAQFPLADVVALCQELDGLPLAIELAAARTSSISPAEILSRLRRVPNVLRSRDPAVPERHRSLTRSLDWSYGLLDPPAAAIYRRLSVFVGGFALTAAERVCASDVVTTDDVAELVWGLVDASLVQHDVTAGATRYRMLRAVRAHAEALAAPDEHTAAMRRLAQLELELVGPALPIDRAWRGAMLVELDNVRHVVTTLAGSDESDEIATAQTLAWSIGRYHDNTDAFRVGIRETSRWIDALRAATPERAALLALLAELHLRLGEVDLAAAAIDDARPLVASVGLPSWDATAVERIRGEIALRAGDLAAAIDIAEAALRSARTARGRARLLNLVGIVHSERGDNAAAAEAFRAEVDSARAAGMESFLTTSLGNLAEVLLRLGDVEEAAATQLDCLELSRSSGGALHLAFSVMIAAHVAATHDDWTLAAQLQSSADVEIEALGWVFYEADAERRRALLEGARRQLGAERFATAIEAGRTIGIERAADIGADELRRIAARRKEPA